MDVLMASLKQEENGNPVKLLLTVEEQVGRFSILSFLYSLPTETHVDSFLT